MSTRDHDDSQQTPEHAPVAKAGRLPVTEMLGEFQGANSPFGDVDLPLPDSALRYEHPEHAAPHDA